MFITHEKLRRKQGDNETATITTTVGNKLLIKISIYELLMIDRPTDSLKTQLETF